MVLVQEGHTNNIINYLLFCSLYNTQRILALCNKRWYKKWLLELDHRPKFSQNLYCLLLTNNFFAVIFIGKLWQILNESENITQLQIH